MENQEDKPDTDKEDVTDTSQAQAVDSSDNVDEITQEDKGTTGNKNGNDSSEGLEKNSRLQDNDLEGTSGSNSESANDSETKLEGFPSTESMNGKKEDYGNQLLQEGIFYDNEIQVSQELVELLTQGFTEKFVPSLIKNKKTVDQIRSTQNVLIETVQQENAKFDECLAINGLEDTMTKAKVYQAKLLKLRKEMTFLHEKSSKLKKRSLRLQQQRQKDEMTKAQNLEVEYEKEKMLTARVATSPSPEKET